MTIKNKLIANLVITALIIGAISLTSYFSISLLQKTLANLTEKSTPLQIRTMELQRELQGCIAALIKVNTARNMAEYATFRADAEKALTAVHNSQKLLEQTGSRPLNSFHEASTIAQELFSALEERINSNDAAKAANENIAHSMQTSSSRLDDMDKSIHDLQASHAKAFTTALELTGRYANSLRNIEELRELIRELQLITVSAQNIRSASGMLIARAKLKALTGRIANNAYYKSNPSIATVADGFTAKLAEYFLRLGESVARKTDESGSRTAELGRDISYTLSDLFQTLDQEALLAREELALANGRQGSIYQQSNSANNILEASSDLVELGLTVTSETNRLFTLESPEELDTAAARIRTLFIKISDRIVTIEKVLNTLHAVQEQTMLRTAAASLSAIRTSIYASNGIVTTLKKRLLAIEHANGSAGKLRDLLLQQTGQAQKSVAIAKTEQEKSIEAVHRTVRWSMSQILAIGSMAIFASIFFGYWIYRTIFLPLQVILDVVRSQQEQGKELAAITEAVANGELNRNVTIRETMALDPSQIKKDEMGAVLSAIVGLSEVQAILSKAFFRMTESLRRNRDADARRERLQDGLHELDKILRGEQEIDELANKALTYIIGFLEAGVGILYRYNETDTLLQPLATYAVSDSGRLNNGFKLGQGLVGQVALEQRILCLAPAPPGYLPISSALGAADPLNIFILPVMHGDILTGVLEVGSFRRINDDDLDFLIQALEALAIVFTVSRSRYLVSNLLEQTQAQAEELRVRQEELQQTNEELEERAQMLAERMKTGPTGKKRSQHEQ